MRKTYFFVCWMWVAASVMGQSMTYSPAYPTVHDSIVVQFDGQGSGLNGVSPVFMHTGVVTSLSTDLGDWGYQLAAWDAGYDSSIVMMDQGGGQHVLGFVPQTFYGLASNEEVRALAMVFRNTDGSVAAGDPNGGDYYIPIFPDSDFCAIFTAPLERPETIGLNDPLQVNITANEPALITVFENGQAIGQSPGLVQDYSISVSGITYGRHELRFSADNGLQVYRDTIAYVVQPPVSVQAQPTGSRDGINYVNDSTVTFVLLAPQKDNVYLIGDFNDWEVDPDYLMHRTPDGNRYWYTLSGLNAGQEYRFQYFVDHSIRIADPYAEKVLDPFNDGGVNSVVYPNLIDYPEGKTTEMVSILQTAKPDYQWTDGNWQRPDNRDLVIYELLIRDFVIRHDYQTVIDSLDYLQSLGINAIEFMPINEFDGNQSWGYGPAFYFAPDKYYGTEMKLKELINECHNRGMAVILDVVFNHSFGQHPMVRLYQDRNTNEIWANNPWFNQEAPHPLGLGYDWDHQSGYTVGHTDSVLAYWADEYHVDGYRLDLSKGMTNTQTGDIGAWSVRDQSRIDILTGYANRFWARHPGRYMILEHFGNNDEEIDLAAAGLMLWGKATEEYNQATMGWENNSDFSYYVSHQHRGWPFHNLVGFMESHDEERLMYNNIQYGNDYSAAHNCRDTTVALRRMGQAAAFFFTVPGPKMIWQFGEYGYDFSLSLGGRTNPKPIVWTYLNDPRRLYLKKEYAALIHLKTQYPNTFRSGSYDISAWGKQKQIHVNANDMNATVVGNFDVVGQETFTGFQHTGWWYDYMSGDSLNVSNTQMTIWLEPGEYRVFTDQRLPVPDLDVSSTVSSPAAQTGAQPMLRIAPNPADGTQTITFELPKANNLQVRVLDLQGRVIRNLGKRYFLSGMNIIAWDGKSQNGSDVPAGCYLLELEGESTRTVGKLVRR